MIIGHGLATARVSVSIEPSGGELYARPASIGGAEARSLRSDDGSAVNLGALCCNPRVLSEYLVD
jgi:hypothetical protein